MKTKLLLVTGISLLTFITKAQVWTPVGNGTNGRIGALAVYNSELYAGGLFHNLADSTWDVLKWNGTTWSSAKEKLVTMFMHLLYSIQNYMLEDTKFLLTL